MRRLQVCVKTPMKKINLNAIPWRERKSPKGHSPRFLRDVAMAFKNPNTGPSLPSEAPFEVELVRLPPGARNCPLHSHATEWESSVLASVSGNMPAGNPYR